MATAEDVPELHRRLVELFGQHRWEPELDPLGELVSTIIGQHTSGVTSRRAYGQLREAFPTWELVRAAETEAIAAPIRCAGLARQKAARIKAVLERVAEERGSLELDFLGELDEAAAMTWLRRLPGVGQTTAACVLLFGLGRPVMPVDGGILRIGRRLGLVPPRGTPEEVQRVLEGAVPAAWIHTLHVNLIRFGRQICLATHPQCQLCPLNDRCDYFQDSLPQGRGLGWGDAFRVVRGAGPRSTR
ncbi:MAG TPA: endonuclease III [Chloroflexota bacterium]|nr:endonuclease III [Chloroflexota bacterium]